MKRVHFSFILMFLACSLSAQVFNTGGILQKRHFNIGINPALIIDGGETNLNMYFHGGFGVADNVDVAFKAGITSGDEYFGGDIEWGLKEKRPAISVTTGAHVWYDFGLDGTLNLSFPVTKGADVYFGADTDIVFGNDIYMPFWIPLGVQIEMNNNIAFVLETEIGLNDEAYHIIGGGINIYL